MCSFRGVGYGFKNFNSVNLKSTTIINFNMPDIANSTITKKQNVWFQGGI